MTTEPFVLRWGIMATGAMAEYFCKDLLTNPEARGVSDVAHRIAAISSSNDPSRAAALLHRIDHPDPSSVRTYGSYTALAQDPDVNIVYVATPHSHHFQNAMLALEAGKHVLCEKALTVTASQAQRMVEVAREKGVFFLEGVWTMFLPLSCRVRELVAGGAIGKVYRVTADLSRANSSEKDGSDDLEMKDSHRMVNLDLAGGVLLGLGVYPLNWVFQVLYHLQPEAEKELPRVKSFVQKYRTGVDESVTILLDFPKHGTTGIVTSSLRVSTDPGPAIRVQGSRGEIHIEHPAYKPHSFKVIRTGEEDSTIEVVECPQPQDEARGWGNGTFWEADEAARCIRDGKTESSVMPLDESVLIMSVMDEVLKEAGVRYPELITSHEFDPLSPLNTGN